MDVKVHSVCPPEMCIQTATSEENPSCLIYLPSLWPSPKNSKCTRPELFWSKSAIIRSSSKRKAAKGSKEKNILNGFLVIFGDLHTVEDTATDCFSTSLKLKATFKGSNNLVQEINYPVSDCLGQNQRQGRRGKSQILMQEGTCISKPTETPCAVKNHRDARAYGFPRDVHKGLQLPAGHRRVEPCMSPCCEPCHIFPSIMQAAKNRRGNPKIPNALGGIWFLHLKREGGRKEENNRNAEHLITFRIIWGAGRKIDLNKFSIWSPELYSIPK